MQLQKETACLPPSCSLLRETIVKKFAVAIWPVTGQGVENTKSCFCCAELNSGIKFDKSTAEARRMNQTFELSLASN